MTYLLEDFEPPASEETESGVGENSKGAKDKTGLYKKMFGLAKNLDAFDVQEQMSMISGISRPQLLYFDGFVDHISNSIIDLKSKFKLSPYEYSTQ